MTPCNDPRFEQMIHGFELGLLTEDDRKEFEAHLLECEHCFQQVQVFLPASVLLRHDGEIPKTLAESQLGADARKEVTETEPRHKRRGEFVRFRVLAIAALLIVTILPLYYFGFRDSDTPDSVQYLDLLPFRGDRAPVLYLDQGGMAEIRFSLESAGPETVCRVVISSRTGTEVFADDAYKGFDSSGVGLIKILVSRFEEGHYTLSVVEPTGRVPVSRREYNFRVE